MSTSAWLIDDQSAQWRAATTGLFLDGVRDGTLPEEAFDRWLEQDRLFVQTLVRAWGLLLTHAPVQDFPLLLAGLQSLGDELVWFEAVAERRGLDLSPEPLPEAAAYNRALIELASREYSAAITAMWAVEAAYLVSWQSTLPAAEPLRDFAEHWANEGFAEFVASLASIVDRELPDGPDDAAQDAFSQVVLHEAAFWRMTVGESVHPTPGGGSR